MAFCTEVLFLIFTGLCCVAGQERECECVKYYLCDENGMIITDGKYNIDIRKRDVSRNAFMASSEGSVKTCPSSLQMCCAQPLETNCPGNQTSLQVPKITWGRGCGRRRFPACSATGLYVNAGANRQPENTFYGEAPWMVVILEQKEKLTYKCGGSLILPHIALTAAHCVKTVPFADLSVRAGEYDNRILKKPIPSQTQKVSRVVSHPNFNSGNLHNDIALLFLEQPMKLNQVVDVICGPKQGLEVIETDCIVTGWGRNAGNGSYQSVLRKVNLPLRTREYCIEKLRISRLGFIYHVGFICAGGDNKDACEGYGGGPLVCPTKVYPNRMVQVGIAVWGVGCRDGFPTVFVSVEHYLPWMHSQIS